MDWEFFLEQKNLRASFFLLVKENFLEEIEFEILKTTVSALKEQVNVISRSTEIKLAEYRQTIEKFSANLRSLEYRIDAIEQMFGGSYGDKLKKIREEITERDE